MYICTIINTNLIAIIMMKQHLLYAFAALMCCSGVFAQPKGASTPQLLLSSEYGLMAPVWSPDGSQIAVTTDNYTGILVADASGRNLRIVTDAAGAGYRMTWQGNDAIVGRSNSYDNGKVTRTLCSWAVNDGKCTVLNEPIRRSNGAAQLYDQMISDPVGVISQNAALTSFAGAMIINPAMSPDGTRIAFQISGKGMWLINADGSGLKSLGSGSHPAWLPDSKNIVYTIVADNGREFTSSTLMAQNVDTAANVVLTQSSLIPLTPAVSPDGTKVAFENAVDKAIYVITLKF